MHPFISPDFHVRWSTLIAEAIEPDITHALQLSESAIEEICNQDPSVATYESTFLAFENATEELGRGWGRLHHLDSVCDYPAQREALNKMLPAVTDFYSSLPLNERLWSILKTFGESTKIEALDPVKKRFVEETLADFRQSGADLPPDQKQRIAAIEAELSKLTKQYAEHVLDSTNAWEMLITDESKLAGLPDSAKAGAAANARAKGLASEEKPAWRFTLQQPSITPVMQHVHDDGLRRQAWEGSSKVGAYGDYDNTALVWQILELRHEKAAILGHSHFADLTLLRRMAKTGSSALDFIENLHQRIESAFHADYQQLAHYKAAKNSQPIDDLEPWEVSYWAERQRQENYDLDDEILRPYFPVDGVMSGMFEIASRVFDISIRNVETVFIEPGMDAPAGGAVEVWHPEVSFYEIRDSTSGAHLGSFYADWHPRESKRGGAWMNSLHTGNPGEPHLGLIVGNMSPPVDGKAALLTHNEVETIFHEFGHLLHGMLSQVAVKSLSGTNVPWDFVELPSQIMENYCWDRESLDLFARHHETGETIPDDLFAKMIAAKNYLSATAFMRQISFARLDLELHIHLDRWLGKDLDEVDREILSKYRASLKTATPSMLRRFNHIFSSPTGYAAGYYSYKWSEVLDADAFTRFQDEGILNPATGRDFREHILSKGNSAPADELYRRFMGRDPELEPLLVRAGLAEPALA
jgi:oligopeptidase A